MAWFATLTDEINKVKICTEQDYIPGSENVSQPPFDKKFTKLMYKEQSCVELMIYFIMMVPAMLLPSATLKAGLLTA